MTSNLVIRFRCFSLRRYLSSLTKTKYGRVLVGGTESRGSRKSGSGDKNLELIFTKPRLLFVFQQQLQSPCFRGSVIQVTQHTGAPPIQWPKMEQENTHVNPICFFQHLFILIVTRGRSVTVVLLRLHFFNRHIFFCNMTIRFVPFSVTRPCPEVFCRCTKGSRGRGPHCCGGHASLLTVFVILLCLFHLIDDCTAYIIVRLNVQCFKRIVSL